MATKGYIGSYTKKDGKGIYRFELDEQTGKMAKVETGFELNASTYLAQFKDTLLAVTKNDERAGLATFKIKKDATLEETGQSLESLKGSGCYVSVSPEGEFAFEAVYGDGLARIYEFDADKQQIVKLIEEVYHEYTPGPNVARQDASHVHYLEVTPEQKYVVAVDLGADLLVTYHYGHKGLDVAHRTELQPGDGPRHIAYHKTGRYAYVVNELSNTVVVMDYEDGQFTERERHFTIPKDYLQPTKLAAVHLSHDQQFLYISNRGHDSIAIFKVLDDGARLELVDIVPSGDEFPRDFNITPSDDYLVVAHEQGDSKVVVFKRDKATGLLTLTDDSQQAAEGVCVKFLED
ncbi:MULTISPECIES: lactonase family protein [unclassified Staphylococcus]|uniref:6-phosphogluconolactonase n=1 Tax=unclassified Staphylococcus TaxID=91994 RepID=UPI0021CFE311|nr:MULTISPECIES: lactonase family protein [unclassified Staphylococcus]UXR69040.1 lactonase family protein [Staphylococcus sp. IVB6246]UXR73385.1 lactonase family protein [Staphylococcus sp. IVB6238]UXR75680.1 lactonase family protein [Staphylococcus sp. IVB6233]UXR79878.1 lactonase family protein [Staphylococcus sp. IVB6218]